MKSFLGMKANGRLASPLFGNRLPATAIDLIKSYPLRCSFLRQKNLPKLISSSKGWKEHSDKASIAPLSLKSQSGQLLSRVMQDNPHLLPSAVDGQLEQLRSHETAYGREDDLEEILYCLIVHKFIENDISMTPSPTHYQEQKLKAIHSEEATDMIDGHLTFLETKLGGRMSKRRLGKLYSACVKYGYYLKRVDERFQLEKCINKPEDSDMEEATIMCNWGSDISYCLRSYIRMLDPEMLQGFAMVRSKEATSVVEKQERALFPEVEEDGEVVEITSSGLRMLVLEAVAFGSFLWGAECYVETHCRLDG